MYSPINVQVNKKISQLRKDTNNEVLDHMEKTILKLIVYGNSNSNIAKKLLINVKSVENNLSSIMRKLDIHSLVDLVKYAVKNAIA